MSPPSPSRSPTLVEALIPVACLFGFLAAAVIDLGSMPRIPILSPILEALAFLPGLGSVLHASVPVQIPLVGAIAVAIVMALRLGWDWKSVEVSLVDGIRMALVACLILLLVGILVGTWIASGIVPMLIVYGLRLFSPDYFLVAACLICCVVSLATGSSWTTAGTIGIALVGVGGGLGIPQPMVAGAIVSGAYFGDKMSPLSDTTNLAPAVAGSELFAHIRHMALTTTPSLLLALLFYWLLGLGHGGSHASPEAIDRISQALGRQYVITPWLLVAPAAVLLMVWLRSPAIPAIFAGAVLGGALAALVQGMPLADVLTTAYDGFKSSSGDSAVDTLLTRGGMSSMYGTIGIILCAMCFGGIMERSGMLGVIAGAILKLAHNTGSLISATLATCIGVNLIAPDQYLSIIVPGRMYRSAYQRAGLEPKNLSRALEDAGTLTSPLVPWNSCGAYMAATLGVFPFAYLPFAFFNLINPLVSALYGWTGWTISRCKPDVSADG